MLKPLISIVTVCYNVEDSIIRTLKSVANQTYKNIQFVIVDGLSTDKTINRVKDFFENNDELTYKILSEKDDGIYDAMNKGIFLSKGEWTIFLNSGDEFDDNFVLSSLFDKDDYSSVTGIFGNTRIINNDQTFISIAKNFSAIRIDYRLPFVHQSVLVRTSVLQVNTFDLKFRYAADYNQFLRLYLLNHTFEQSNIVISKYELGGFSDKNIVKYSHDICDSRYLAGVDKKFNTKRMLVVKIKIFLRSITPLKIIEIYRKRKYGS